MVWQGRKARAGFCRVVWKAQPRRRSLSARSGGVKESVLGEEEEKRILDGFGPWSASPHLNCGSSWLACERHQPVSRGK